MQNQSLVINTQAGASLSSKATNKPSPWRSLGKTFLKAMPGKVGVICESIDCINAVHIQKGTYFSAFPVELHKLQSAFFGIERKPAPIEFIMFSRLGGRINQEREYARNSNNHTCNLLVLAEVGKYSGAASNEYKIKEKSYLFVKPHMHAIPNNCVIDIQLCFIFCALITHNSVTYFCGGLVGFLNGGTWVLTCPVSVIIESFRGGLRGVRAFNLTMEALFLFALGGKASL